LSFSQVKINRNLTPARTLAKDQGGRVAARGGIAKRAGQAAPARSGTAAGQGVRQLMA